MVFLSSIPLFHDIRPAGLRLQCLHVQGGELLRSRMTSDVSGRLDVLCPDREAMRHLTFFLEQHVLASGAVALTLRLPGKLFTTRRMPLERRFYATLSTLRSASDPGQMYSVKLAHTSMSSPYVSGTLAIRASHADDCLGLILAGRHEPQSDVVDSPFDSTEGHRIAQASVLALLRSIATPIEVASARNEAAHAGKHAIRLQSVGTNLTIATAMT